MYTNPKNRQEEEASVVDKWSVETSQTETKSLERPSEQKICRDMGGSEKND